ncbi:glycosyltransferase family 2 protein [Paramicrobacterium agarici]|uniref:Glycosyltransferase involved in cell wall biosynthesis n=1 Tax=Paramicrobacterium agarici TaxID=630514 RepID=A0A2A9DVR4_9MICO|nr:glycosyltransferase family 2 protein [Microbacterium agarici]PFG30674.1 glycosyltransferase involved in cell wall biosynthesis [Microbacterium agarici]
MASDLVSVVIPHFNSSKTLARALDSVVAQSWPVHEVIVVDDASSKSERLVAQEIIAGREGTRLILLEVNGGPANARNIGWNEAKAEWVAFLDSDDAWHPRKIELQIQHAIESNPPAVLIASRTVQVNAPSDLDSIEVSLDTPAIPVRKRELLLRNRMSTPSVVLRREIPERFAANRRFSEDYELWLTLVGKGYPVLLIDAPLAAVFKAPYGASGLSSRIWSMILGEYRAYLGARNAGALSMLETVFGILNSTAKSCIRLLKILSSKIRRGFT